MHVSFPILVTILGNEGTVSGVFILQMVIQGD